MDGPTGGGELLGRESGICSDFGSNGVNGCH
jgi:hypothetical protein